MIQANEIRIGNIFQYFIGEDGCEWEETKIDWQDIKWAVEKNENFNQVHKAIPLSLEWLERCGIENRKVNLDDGYYIITGVDYSYLQQKRVGEMLIVSCQYLHQLQNLYYALTGTELTIKQEA